MRFSRLAAAGALTAGVICAYLAYVARYAVNGVYQDEWNWVELVSSANSRGVSLGDLWRQHNENRMFFPNAVAVGVGNITRFNDLAFIYLGAACLIVAFGLLVWACRPEVLRHPLAYLPVVFVFFSLAQYENTLWSFQLAWFIVVLCLAGTLAVLFSRRVGWVELAGAAVLATIGSYSSIQGLTIWAAGLVALCRVKTSNMLRAAWIGAGAVVTGLYMNNLDLAAAGAPPLATLPPRLPEGVRGFFIAVGNVVPDLGFPNGAGGPESFTPLLGLLISVAGLVVLAAWWLTGRQDRVLTMAAALVVVGLLFDLLLVPGRLSVSSVNGTLSRYTTFNLLLLAGAYLGATRLVMRARAGGQRLALAVAGPFMAVMLGVVCLQVPSATRAGILGAARTRAYHAEAADLTANYAKAPPDLVKVFDYPPSYDYFRTQAAFLEAHRMNVFGDGESARHQATGILSGGSVDSPLPVPSEIAGITVGSQEWRAWLALSSVYDQRPDLQKAFPGRTMKASREMIGWAIHSGLGGSDPIDAAVLQPYAPQYKSWAATTPT